MFEAAALQEGIEFALDIRRQGRVLCGHVVYKRGVVLLGKLIEERLFGAVALVTVSDLVWAGLPVGTSTTLEIELFFFGAARSLKYCIYFFYSQKLSSPHQGWSRHARKPPAI